MGNVEIAKNLLLRHSCLNCKWTSNQRILPELEVTTNVLDEFKQVCYNKEYVLSQKVDDIFFNSFKNGKASFWIECPSERICPHWEK